MSTSLKVLCESKQRVRGTRNRERKTVVAGPFSVGRSGVTNDIKAQLLESNTDVLSGGVKRNTSKSCFNRFIRLWIESKMRQIVITKVGQDSLVIDHAVDY
jgi:3-deoxy-D-arabino-heptulosonate 7-phosphate (DAHP) synthase